MIEPVNGITRDLQAFYDRKIDAPVADNDIPTVFVCRITQGTLESTKKVALSCSRFTWIVDICKARPFMGLRATTD